MYVRRAYKNRLPNINLYKIQWVESIAEERPGMVSGCPMFDEWHSAVLLKTQGPLV